ncbi:hypothetical protein [Reyranella sp.]|jgi:hypothetical protein|uniref:hypothetical protein n=1 Tax=Reyranella sp. TaxID=1929291 RepID=UPI000BC6FD13|nr:hypothetical protein [Reyranella sp.]OYY35664.1 MAG: hypothetical protein B7Y57_26170 [Rhodospirillales bacterium 35-66-84]OYZ91534.1 MAG: hypothetical protein B7Y08_26040 [Rhodospirillales bacterium 24-66-33]OZB22071.1 MAG: hypothetical protein B7X63_24965 [Rhodospirillales bacterium 39-66-50]HQS14902.1 hypothetical protein [Reyranella sp.]HQT10711.1 hypothetical protein [Reyranella sp.]
MRDGEPRIDFGQAAEVTGELLAQDNAVMLTLLGHDGRRSTLTIPAADLQRLVPLLLLLGRALPQHELSDPAKLSLVPTDSLSVGGLPGGETLLAVAVGPATVGFSLPASAAEKLGRSLLLVGNDAAGATSIQ